MQAAFAINYDDILAAIDRVDPVRYGRTRNYVDGAVTHLSPYISRGVISTRTVLERVLAKGYDIDDIEYFVMELCWRDYFQRIGQVADLRLDIKQPQELVLNHGIPVAVVDAATGIDAIDVAIKQLYTTGYLHNHCRMYVAALVCNIAKSHWHLPSQWMYFHLFDGDWASNACSWQWVAGANSKKKYFANQANINQHTFSRQVGTYLDRPVEELPGMEVPAVFTRSQSLRLFTELPTSAVLSINDHHPTYIYNYYNLDPEWHKGEQGNRILLLEPDFFSHYPVSKNCMDFLLKLSGNIPGIQVHVGSFRLLADQLKLSVIHYKEHPLNIGYAGITTERDWIAPDVVGYYPSFFSYWKRVKKHLR